MIQELVQWLGQQTELGVLQSSEWKLTFGVGEYCLSSRTLLNFFTYLQGPALNGERATNRPRPDMPLRHLDCSPTRLYITMYLGRRATLRGVVHVWGNTRHDVLTLAPRVLLISLARFARRQGQARKLRQPIRVAKIIGVPMPNRTARFPGPWVANGGRACSSIPLRDAII